MELIVVRGAGDLATGVIHALSRAGWRVLATERENPAAVRRLVALSTAVAVGAVTVEGLEGRYAPDLAAALNILSGGAVPVLIDPDGTCIDALRPRAVVDARMLKRPGDTHIHMAPCVLGIGPGLCAGLHCHAVVETNRGPELGRVILAGEAAPDTGVPGVLGGESSRRVLRAPAAGAVHVLRDIGSLVTQGEPVAEVGGISVHAAISGLVRGMLPEGFPATTGLKLGDIDPRADITRCMRISDKAHTVAGGVCAALHLLGVRPR